MENSLEAGELTVLSYKALNILATKRVQTKLPALQPGISQLRERTRRINGLVTNMKHGVLAGEQRLKGHHGAQILTVQAPGAAKFLRLAWATVSLPLNLVR